MRLWPDLARAALAAAAALAASPAWADAPAAPLSAPQAPAAAAAAAAPTERADGIVQAPSLFTADDLLLLEVDADGYQISDGTSAFSSRAGLFLPLGELTRLFDLAINVDAARGHADGFILERSRVLSLDLAQHQAEVGGKIVAVPAEAAASFDGDIYVRSDVMEALLPLKFKAALHDLVLTVTPTEKLPFEARLAREQARSRLAGGAGAEPVLKVRTPYALFSPPSFDADINLGGGNVTPKTFNYAIRAAGDLAYANFQAYANSDDSGRLSSVRLLLERTDPDGRDVVIPGVTRADLGDTFTPSLLVGPRSDDGRGFSITSEPLEQVSVFDKLTLRGELATGYEVELYVNEVLRGSLAGATDGRYEFDDVELSFGINTIRLVFYGPRGERREEVRRINVGAGLLPPGHFTYSLGAVQQGVPVVDIKPPGLLVVPLPGTGRERVVGDFAYGLTRSLTLTAAFADYTPTQGLPRQMGSLGLSASLGGYALQATAASDDRGGDALVFGVAGRPFGVSVVLKQSIYLGSFIDELQSAGLGDGTPLRRDTAINIDYALPLKGGSLPMSLRATADGFADGGQRWDVAFNTSKPINRYLASASFDYEGQTGPSGGNSNLNGDIALTGLFGHGWQLRGDLSFEAVPTWSLESLGFTAQRNLTPHIALQLGISHSFAPPTPSASINPVCEASPLASAVNPALAQNCPCCPQASTGLAGNCLGMGTATTACPCCPPGSSGLACQGVATQTTACQSLEPGGDTTFTVTNTWRLRHADLSLTASYSTTHNDFRIGLQISTGLIFNPLKGRYVPAGPDAAAGGSVLVDAFVDSEGAGVRGPSDKAVPGIAVSGGRADGVTDASGEVLITGLGGGASARVHLDTEKVDDPYLTPPPNIVEIVPRPGRLVVVPYPLAATSEIEIMALFAREGGPPRGLSALALQLVSTKGEVAAQGRTEYDGTLLLENVRAGSYALRIDPDQSKRLGLALKTPVTIVAKPNGGFTGEIKVEVVRVTGEESDDAPQRAP